MICFYIKTNIQIILQLLHITPTLFNIFEISIKTKYCQTGDILAILRN